MSDSFPNLKFSPCNWQVQVAVNEKALHDCINYFHKLKNKSNPNVHNIFYIISFQNKNNII
jgi:hypothetical protein